ncbi:MAG TPA: aminopeptidase P family N-terminal domain-containing protein, partial [Holophaga sp.]|nr:aminopeptidase P family N-terminal domain-containing protein [Holophaga sp.]
MKPKLLRRVRALQALMAPAGLDAVLFADRENCIYYLGTTDIECAAVVIPAAGDPVACCLWLDAPYVKERSEIEDLLAYRFPASTIGKTIVAALRRLDLAAPRVGFHKYFVEFGIFDALRQAFPAMAFLPAMDLTYRVRAVKDQEELALIEAACAFVDVGMRAAVDALRPGLTEGQVLAEADYTMRRAGSEGATFR